MIIALALLAVGAAPAAAATCPYQARCGSITVPLDHSGATPGTLPLGYAVLPATGPKTGTIFFLSGGPGESAVIYTSEIRKAFGPLRKTQDIVMVDQRGTGRSGATSCEESRSAAACAKKLGAKRAFLTTAETARDLDDLRVALGLEKITPLGVSYGTKVAGEYARRFPDRTASVILDSTVGVDAIDFDALSGIAAMPRILREVCADGPCAGTVKDAGAALYAAVKRVRDTKVVAHLGGEKIRVGEGEVFLVLRGSDFDPVMRADLPAALASLAHGDAAPFVHLFGRGSADGFRALRRFSLQSDDGGYSTSRFLATACLEARLPWSPSSAISTRKAATKAYLAQLGSRPYAPFKPSLVSKVGVWEDCRKWPATPAPEPPPATTPDVPVLVISGRDDIRTPLEGAEAVAAAFPHATLLTVPHVGHSVLTTDEDGCALAGAAAFLAGQPVAPCATKPTVPAGAYYPAVFSGGPAKAAEATVAAIRHDVEAAKGGRTINRTFGVAGLRGGSAIARRGALELRKVSQFTGLRVSGKVSAAGNGTLTLSGKREGTVVLRAFKAQSFRPR
ncbi:alpha/beta hydrolase [Solirubrobacter ginsenosidimutans]|uniref:Alpha/beta hydrolase n=1 Tax=Solirubrobacter ginsenosidimutans TaxID=490573 RepID=A0A9X3MT01_9ACTN|nr:alpha/beta fold hydrolase [Solirubrobacter ginsenosidimutans]MDA0161847.1 alpha/beta hydrolase [Solirubrobacter ginsenosidimutans]